MLTADSGLIDQTFSRPQIPRRIGKIVQVGSSSHEEVEEEEEEEEENRNGMCAMVTAVFFVPTDSNSDHGRRGGRSQEKDRSSRLILRVSWSEREAGTRNASEYKSEWQIKVSSEHKCF